jgi:twitching motility protein PilT
MTDDKQAEVARWKAAVEGSVARLEQILHKCIELHPNCSDIQFVGGDQVWVHENGAENRTQIPMTDQLLLQWADAFGLKRGGATELYTGAKGTLEVAQDIIGIRLRMTWRRQYGKHGKIALNVRLLPSEPPALDGPRFQANPVPQELVEMVMDNNDGLILFEGPTGSGKSTMQAALVNEVNKRQARHIYTIEDPIEFVHTSGKSLVTQREVHTDVDSFYQGLQTAKRSKPGIILLGELRDPVTKRAALESAGEGHLVLATSHASAVPEAIATFVGAFPSDEQNDVAQRMAVSLRGVIVQSLVPSVDGRVVPVREMLTVTDIIASKLRDRETGQDLRAVLMSSETRKQAGTFSRDDDLLKLVQQGKVAKDVALRRAINPSELNARIGGAA